MTNKTITLIIVALLLCVSSAAQENVSYQKDYRYLVDRINGIYIPKDINEAIESLDTILITEDKCYIADSLSLDEFRIQFHHNLGMWIRNYWGLWGGSRLQRYFLDRKVMHPDDMSDLILKAYYKKKIQGLDYSTEDDIDPQTPMIDEVIESPLSKDVRETKRDSKRMGCTKGETVYFMYPYGCSTKEEDKIRLNIKNKNYDQLPKGKITDIDYVSERIKVKLIDTISPHGIIIFDGDERGEFSDIKRDFDNFIVNTPNRFYMQKGDELWFDINSASWETGKRLKKKK
ncbi:MAG: hypothetical protein J5888_07835 [Bacteroidaceae bacterium]|nr:hypothetical protein [Bacteroidaceae bacterium]